MDTARPRRRRRIDWADIEPIGVGEALRAGRERLDLTIEEAAESTRIRASYLLALEDEDFALLPEAVAGRGFLRTYATFVKLDAIELLGALDARGRLALAPANVQREARRPPPVQPLTPRLLGLVAALAILLGLVYYVASQYSAFVDGERSVSTPQTPVSRGVGVTATTVATPTPVATFTPVPSPTSLAKPTAQPTVALPAVAAAPTARLLTPTAAAASPTPASTPTQRLEVVVEAKISADCWARVEVDDRLSFEGTLSARDQRTWRGSKVTIQVADAGAIEIILNGKPLGKLGANGQARTVTWTR